MNEFHKEMLDTIIKDWDVVKVDTYISELEERGKLLKEWIRHLRVIRKKKVRTHPVDTGIRSGT
jgi:hypothetical protein